MSQNYYCYVRDSFGECLQDGYSDVIICILNSLDFATLVNHGYSVEILDLVDASSREFSLYCRRLSRRTTKYILTYDKLPKRKHL